MDIPLWQKVLGAIIYLLPWSDAIPFGAFLFNDIPQLQWLVIPAIPIIFIQNAIPFGGIILFFILFLSIVRSPKASYFLKFNTLQAILIDIGIIITGLAFQILFKPLGSSLIISTLSSTILIGALAMTSFSIWKCLQGEEPDLPGISEAVRMQL